VDYVGIITIKNNTGGILTVTPVAGTIDGEASISLLDHEALMVKSDGSNWLII